MHLPWKSIAEAREIYRFSGYCFRPTQIVLTGALFDDSQKAVFYRGDALKLVPGTMSDEALQLFLDSANAWICDGYSLDIRYLADSNANDARIWDAQIQLNPLPPDRDHQLRIGSDKFRAGQIQLYPQSKASLLQVLSDAAAGSIPLAGCRLSLAKEQSISYYSEMSHRDRWFSPLHLLVAGSSRVVPTSIELVGIDNVLRGSNPPFDGLSDIANWLGLRVPGTSSNAPSIVLQVGPPADLITDKCVLKNDQLILTIHAHPKLDVSRIGLAVRAVPGTGLSARKHVTESIAWKRTRNGRREGVIKVQVEQADNVLVMLLIGDSMVRRNWFIDSDKARNNRFLAIQHFDKDLRMIRQAVLEHSDSSKFEMGIAALLFLLGFSPSVQLETDAPDLVVTTPGGRLVIVECTTRVADFQMKLGKLVDRRGGLLKSLEASGHSAQVAAVLICRLPKNQIAAEADSLLAHKVILLTNEDLVAGLDRVRFPGDPDKLLLDGLAQISGASNSLK